MSHDFITTDSLTLTPFVDIARTLGQFAPAAQPVEREAPAADIPCVRSMLIRGFRAEAREADFIFSTDTIDSYGDRVEQSWRLERFAQNPVALFAHDSRSLPIGRAKAVGVVDGKLQGTIVFASARANPVAEQVWQSIQEGTLRAVSVGFIPHSVRVEREKDVDVVVLSDNELLEISVVPIPANADALMRIRQKAAAGVSRGADVRTEPMPEMHENEKAEAAPAVEPADATVTITLDTSAIDAVEKRIDEAVERMAAIEAQNKALVAERDAALARAAAAEGKLIELEVDKLIGVKLTPAERDTFVKLAKRDRELFDELVAQRTPMTILRRDPAGMGTDHAPVVQTAETLTDDNGGAFARLANERAGR